MLLFRRFLVWLRREFTSDFRKFFLYAGFAAVVLAGASLAIDAILLFGGVGTVIRAVFLVPTSIAIFALIYGFGLLMHNARINNDPQWIPYRSRWSPSWRRRISFVVAAFLLVIVLTVGNQVGYTLINSSIGACLIALVAFCRLTKVEEDRSNLGIPNVQDLQFNSFSRLRDKRRDEVKSKPSDSPTDDHRPTLNKLFK